MSGKIIHGDCLTVMPTLDESSIDAIVTDPPYGLGFMGKEWDDLPPGREWAEECLRVLKPGGHLLAFGGTRTWHRLAVAIEDAGFQVRDSIAWLYGSGFPKSLDVSKAIDKAAGATREVVGKVAQPAGNKPGGASLNMSVVGMPDTADITAPATPEAEQWQGWGTALKPAFEPIVVARKPVQGGVAANVLDHGTGALNIDACRIGTSGGGNVCPGGDQCKCVTSGVSYSPTKHPVRREGEFGRWPANVILDESQAFELDRQSGASLSQFFYVAKAPAKHRPVVDQVAHPTVKPKALMCWLVRLVTPPGGTVLDPFAGSGTTVEAAILGGFSFIAIEREAGYIPLIGRRTDQLRGSIFGDDDVEQVS
jgi:site-specific DNA-methyltransferase (adenine-specific)